MKNFTLSLLLIGNLFVTTCLYATHNRAGEITYQQIGQNQIEASIITYTKASSLPADRDSLIICWGDGLCEYISRDNGGGNGEIIGSDVRENIYSETHVYDSPGFYTISLTDPNRNGGILNVNFPNSDQVAFHIESTVNVLEGVIENNHSPILLEKPVDIGFVGQPFFHTPNAFDLDGDSITYEFVAPMMDVGTEVSNYQDVTQINPGPGNAISINTETGMISWDSPQKEGEYNIAIMIKAYRNGALIDKMIRDMQILIMEGSTVNPEIDLTVNTEEVIDVIVGDVVTVDVSISDIDEGQILELTSTSGLYSFFESPATFTATTDGNTGEGQFEWTVGEEHIRNQPYQVVFKAKDDFEGNGAVNFAVARFRVSGNINSTIEFPNEELARIFPNPSAEGVFTLDLIEDPGILDYQILNTQGQLLKAGKIRSSKEILDLRDLSPGTYIFQLVQKERRLIRKIVIAK